MRKKSYIVGSIMLASFCLGVTSCVTNKAGETEYMAYKDTNLSASQRADDLLARLTLEEKVSLMMNDSQPVERLGIKPYEWWNEALHGVARAGEATVFPQAIGVAATFDPDAVEEMFDAVSDEARAKHRQFAAQDSYKRYQGLTFWTPNINIFRDPRWGRGQETYGEDPYLTSRMGVSVVRGLQGVNTQYDKTHACAKHFAVHSGPEWCRHSFDAANISARDLRETYLPAFQALVQEGRVKEVMCAYNSYEGEPCCGSDKLLQQILRNEWGFDGIVTTDCWAVNDFYNKGAHETHENAEDASAAAVRNGTDIECGSDFRTLVEAVRNGRIDESSIDISVHRLLKARFELGIMDDIDPFPQIANDCVSSKKHADVALKMALESIVLLQNNNDALPLKKGMKVAVLGPNANDSVMQWGNYNGVPRKTSTLLKSIEERLGADNVVYEQLGTLVSHTTLKSLWAQCKSNNATGFDAKYWNNPNMSGEVAATAQASTPIRFSTQGGTAVAAGVQLHSFSAKYQSTFTPDHDGVATFRFRHTMSKLKIVVDGDTISSTTHQRMTRNVGELKFEKGKSYNIEVLYAGGEADNSLSIDLAEIVNTNLNDVVEKIKNVDVILYCGGLSPSLEGEEMPVDAEGFRGGDREVIELPKVQQEIVDALASVGKKLVFVNYSGSAIALKHEASKCDAIVQAWYPGQEGGEALARILMGEANPSGRLPVTFYESTSQMPDFLDYSMKGRTYRYMTQKPLFAFGHGLSYTTYAMSDAQASTDTLRFGQNFTLDIDITNEGSMDGEEVLQVYIRRVGDTEGPVKTLRAFQRVFVPQGQKANAHIVMPWTSFATFDDASQRMQVLDGEYVVYYGSSSADEKLKSMKLAIRR